MKDLNPTTRRYPRTTDEAFPTGHWWYPSEKPKRTSLTKLDGFFISGVLMYLIGSFVSIDWNPVNWTYACRVVIAVWWLVFGFAFSFKLEFENE